MNPKKQLEKLLDFLLGSINSTPLDATLALVDRAIEICKILLAEEKATNTAKSLDDLIGVFVEDLEEKLASASYATEKQQDKK